MFKLMIADDNPFVLRELCNFIDWEDFDLSLHGSYPNGKALLDAAKIDMPDVIITDIAMPVMNGLQLASSIRELSSDVKIIFISSYAEFIYAQQAFPLQISGYILKPFSDDQLTQLMKQVLNELCQEYLIRLEKERSLHQLELMRNIALENYIMSLMYHPKENALVRTQLKELDLEIFSSFELQVAIIDLLSTENSTHTDFIRSFRLIMNRYQRPNYKIIATPSGMSQVILLFILGDGAPDTADLLAELCIDIKTMFGLGASIGYSSLANDFALLPNLFHQAKAASELANEATMISFEDISSSKDTTKNYYSPTAKKHVEKMKKYIQEHYTEPITTHSVSDAVYLSASYASHCFNLECGCSIFDYITQNRIQEAKHLLAETDEPVAIISELVGYSGKTNFYLAFKKHVGVSPALYRRTHQE